MARDIERPDDSERRGVEPRLIGGLVLVVLLVVFVVQNTDSVTMNFLFFSWDSRLWVMLAITAVIGMLIGYLAGRRGARRG